MNTISVRFSNMSKHNWKRGKYDVLYGSQSMVSDGKVNSNSWVNVDQQPNTSMGARGGGGDQVISLSSVLGSALSKPSEAYIQWISDEGLSFEVVLVARVQIAGIGPRPYWLFYLNNKKNKTQFTNETKTFVLGDCTITAKGKSTHASLDLTVNIQTTIK